MLQPLTEHGLLPSRWRRRAEISICMLPHLQVFVHAYYMRFRLNVKKVIFVKLGMDCDCNN